jgi:uncharacterized membrane protein YfcA
MMAPALLAIIPNLLLGVALGAVGGLLGIGGGLIAIPLLGFVYGMDQHLAQGTALVMILPNVLIGFVRYRQRNAIDLRATAWLCLTAVAATFISAHFAARIDGAQLRVAFAMFLLVLAAYFMWQLRVRPGLGNAWLSPRFLPVVGVISGLMSGLFSVGGGLVAVPALVSLFGMKQTMAQGLAMALVVPASVVALFSYAQAGHVSWTTGLALAIGGLLSVSWGVALAHRFSPRRLRLTFCAVLIATALFMLFAH